MALSSEGFEFSTRVGLSATPEAAGNFLAAAGWWDESSAIAVSLPVYGAAWDVRLLRWAVQTPRISIGTLEQATLRGLLAGRLSLLAALPLGCETVHAAGLEACAAGAEVAPLGLAASPFDGLDAWVVVSSEAMGAMATDAGGAGPWQLGIAGTLRFQPSMDGTILARLSWIHQDDNGGPYRGAAPDEWWIDQPLLAARRIEHLELLGAGRGGDFTWGGLALASLPWSQRPGVLVGAAVGLSLDRLSETAVDDQPDTLAGPAAGQGETLVAPPAEPGRLRLALAGRGCSADYVDQSGDFLDQPLAATADFDWAPQDWLVWRNRFSLALERYPALAQGSATPQRPVAIGTRGSLQLADRSAGGRFGWSLDGRQDAGAAWSHAESLSLRLGLSPRGPAGEWRLVADGNLEIVEGGLERAGASLSGSWRKESGKGRLSLGFRAGLAAPAAWWNDPAAATPSLAKACAVNIRAQIRAGLVSDGDWGNWRLSLDADAGLENATADSDWSRWIELLSGRIGLKLAW